MSRSITFVRQAAPAPAQEPRRVFTVPAIGTYALVRHDFETQQWSYKARALTIGYNPRLNPDGAYPDTCYMPGLRPTDFHPLSPAWQFFWLALMKAACYNQIPDDEMLKRWAIITSDGRALNDRHTWNWVKDGEPKLYADYVQSLNLNSQYGPMQIKSLTMGGNLVRIKGAAGENWLIETLDITQAPPAVGSIWDKPYLIHWGTQSTIHIYNGTQFRITDWSWLNWNGVGYGVPFPLVGLRGENLIPKAWTRPIANGAQYSPYIP